MKVVTALVSLLAFALAAEMSRADGMMQYVIPESLEIGLRPEQPAASGATNVVLICSITSLIGTTSNIEAQLTSSENVKLDKTLIPYDSIAAGQTELFRVAVEITAPPGYYGTWVEINAKYLPDLPAIKSFVLSNPTDYQIEPLRSHLLQEIAAAATNHNNYTATGRITLY